MKCINYIYIHKAAGPPSSEIPSRLYRYPTPNHVEGGRGGVGTGLLLYVDTMSSHPTQIFCITILTAQQVSNIESFFIILNTSFNIFYYYNDQL